MEAQREVESEEVTGGGTQGGSVRENEWWRHRGKECWRHSGNESGGGRGSDTGGSGMCVHVMVFVPGAR